jgi:GTP-binding protein
MAEKGEPAEERWLSLELRLIADVGIVGVPNAGKSTLLAALTNARPKIADYPFTTTEPNLGVTTLEGEPLVLADIPGLIEGAHKGAGLGTEFLRHIRRTRVLIHLIDGSAADPLVDFSQINAELALFDPALGEKPQVVAVNKMDLPDVRDRWPGIQPAFGARGVRPLPISALAHTGLSELLASVREALRRAPPSVEEAVPLYKPEPGPSEYTVGRDPDGAWRVSGKAIERAAKMTYWEHEEAVRRFQGLLEHLGVEDALREAGARAGETVRIGEYELEWQD